MKEAQIETISDAIKVLKEKRDELKRIIEIERKSLKVFIPTIYKNATEYFEKDENAKEEFKFKDLESRIYTLKTEIKTLRNRMDYTAHQTKVKFGEKEMTLAQLRLEMEEAREDVSRIQALQTMEKRGGFLSDRTRLKEDDKEKEVPQVSEKELERMLSEKIQIKDQMDRVLEKINVTTKLIAVPI